jgi:hypothetical protein
VPVHPQLIKLGFLEFVATQANTRGDKGWLFPMVAPGTKGAAGFSKWFGRYIGAHGVTDPAKVFHSFRHAFTDALRLANVNDEIRNALLGWSGVGMAARYGAKDKAARLRHRLTEAVAGVTYEGLDLSGVSRKPLTLKRGRDFQANSARPNPLWPSVCAAARSPITAFFSCLGYGDSGLTLLPRYSMAWRVAPASRQLRAVMRVSVNNAT